MTAIRDEYNSHKDARETLGIIIDKLGILIITFGTVATAVSVSRITSQGWHIDILSDLLVFIAVIVVVFLRKKMPISLVMALLLSLAGLGAVSSFISLGLATVSWVILSMCCVIAGASFGILTGIFTLIASVISIGIIGVLEYYDLVPGAFLESNYLHEPQTWLTQLLGYAFHTSVMLAGVGSIQRRLSDSLHKVTRQSAALKESEEEYRLLAENMPDVLFIQDMNFNITYTSPSVEKVFGYSVEEILSIHATRLLTPESFAKATESFKRYTHLAQDQDIEIPLQRCEYVRKDGSRFWGELRVMFLRDEKGNLRGSQGTLRDITHRVRAEEERKELEQKLLQSEKMQAIGQLAGGVAHDFNNQLVGIMANAEMLRQDYKKDPEIVSYADSILKPSRRAAALTEKLLAFARRGNYERNPTDIHAIISEVIAILERSIDKTIGIKFTTNAVNSVIAGDSGQIQNALLNLGLNARDAMPEGGVITFSTRSPMKTVRLKNRTVQREYIEISVGDTGTGIDPSLQKRIFEPFFTTKKPGRGTGMGLAAVYGTIKSHNGTIDVASEKGKGTIFTIAFPSASRTQDSNEENEVPFPVGARGRILVVDDEESVKEAFVDMLGGFGYTAEGFTNAKDAIIHYQTSWKKIDLVVLDLILPVMSGKEAFEKFVQINDNTKVLFVSGYSEDGVLTDLLKNKSTGFLKKPFKAAELSKKVSDLINPPD
ncbi:MAG: PAS domain S-box protein [Chitinivibrionales bacterium]|nr:PAS domain S-box protein [Chitinivibrionales bacterium]